MAGVEEVAEEEAVEEGQEAGLAQVLEAGVRLCCSWSWLPLLPLTGSLSGAAGLQRKSGSEAGGRGGGRDETA